VETVGDQTTIEVLRAPLVIEYPFVRTTGPVIGAFLTALRARTLVGITGADGRVIVPPVEYDPVTAEDLTEMVEVGPAGTVTACAWVGVPRDEHPLDRPFAWALIRPDGADTSMVHVVDAPRPDTVTVGTRVTPHWREETEGAITDIAYFAISDGDDEESR
jgi:uncharacterized OB-fold protein